MKKIITLLSFLIACFCGSANAQESSVFRIDASSARLYLSMADKALNSQQMPDDVQWDSLFSSPAYDALFKSVRWNKKTFRKNVRRAFEIVFDPARSTLCDSILQLLDTVGLSDIKTELPFYVSTAANVRNNFDKYSAMLTSVDMDSVAAEADALALSLVPDAAGRLTPQPCTIYFIVWDLECRALGDNLFLDVNTFFHDGLRSATEMLGHEIHHLYLPLVFGSVYDRDIPDGAAIALVSNMREGVADILNKKHMPLESLYPYGRKMLDVYNEDYCNSPQVLAQLDSITCDYLDGKIDMDQYFQAGIGAAHFEGHTTGDFMVFLIRDHLGLEAVIESVGDLDAFVDNYNLAAEKAGTYRFSDRFTRHIHNISMPAKKRQTAVTAD